MRNNRGNMYLVCIGLAALVLLLFLFVLDVQRLYAERDMAEYELERAAVSALTVALDGQQLSDHSVQISKNTFENTFSALAIAAGSRYNWRCENITTVLTENPPSVAASCDLTLRFEFLSAFMPLEVTVPVTVYAGHGRLDE